MQFHDMAEVMPVDSEMINRTRAWLLAEIEAAGLRVLGRTDAKPKHPRAADRTDPLHAARAAELTSLWRLGQP